MATSEISFNRNELMALQTMANCELARWRKDYGLALKPPPLWEALERKITEASRNLIARERAGEK